MRIVADFDRGKCFEVNGRKPFLKRPDQVNVILKRKVWMEPTDDVELGDSFGPALSCQPEGFFQGHGVSARSVGFAAEGAELATGYTDVRGVDVAVDVEVGSLAVQAKTDLVGEITDGEQVVRPV